MKYIHTLFSNKIAYIFIIDLSFVIAFTKIISNFIGINVNYYIENYDKMIVIVLGYICILILAHYFSVFFHELGHYFVLKKKDLDILLFVVGPVVYTKNSVKSRFRLRISGPLIWGGCVIPSIEKEITNEKELELFKRKFVKILKGGIFSTSICYVVSLFFVFYIFNKFYLLVAAFFMFSNWSILRSLFQKTGNVQGDFCIIKVLKNNPNFIAAFIHNNILMEFPVNTFIMSKCEEFVCDVLNKEEYKFYIFNVLEKIIVFKTVEGQKLNIDILRFIQELFGSCLSEKCDLYRNISICKFMYHVLLYEYVQRSEDLNKHYNIFLEFTSKKFNENENIKIFVSKYSDNISNLINGKKNPNRDNIRYVNELNLLLYDCIPYREMVAKIEKKINI